MLQSLDSKSSWSLQQLNVVMFTSCRGETPLSHVSTFDRFKFISPQLCRCSAVLVTRRASAVWTVFLGQGQEAGADHPYFPQSPTLVHACPIFIYDEYEVHILGCLRLSRRLTVVALLRLWLTLTFESVKCTVWLRETYR